MAKDRLYYDDARLLEFDAKVASCEGPKKDEAGRDLWMVKLSPNAFYPESGGQPSDRGTVDGKPVMDIAEDDAGDVVVMLGEQVSGDVHCVIDGARRFDLMQQHTGQHILSAALERLFGYETVGFHLSDEYYSGPGRGQAGGFRSRQGRGPREFGRVLRRYGQGRIRR